MKVGFGGGSVGSGIVGDGLGSTVVNVGSRVVREGLDTTAVKVGSVGGVEVCVVPQPTSSAPMIKVVTENVLMLICAPV
jgi:hypothetical protein